jgi:hypothetical protein
MDKKRMLSEWAYEVAKLHWNDSLPLRPNDDPIATKFFWLYMFFKNTNATWVLRYVNG